MRHEHRDLHALQYFLRHCPEDHLAHAGMATGARGGCKPIRLKGEEDAFQVRETRMRPMMTRRPVAAMTAINFF
jgi:hypothetical protein